MTTMRRRIIDWVLTGLLLLIPALVLRSSLSRGEPSAVDETVLRITAPLQTFVSWITDGVGSVWSGYVALIDVESENRELRDDNEKLRRELATMSRRAYDVQALEDLALVKKRIAADMIGARVIGAPLTPFRVSRLRIDRGASEIQPNMAVIAGTGPVGVIDKVFGDYADVVLISDTRSKIDVVVKRTGRRGFLRGLGKDDAYTCEITSLELASQPDQRAQVGDEIVTSGVGSIFPPGLVIGKITKAPGDEKGNDGMFQKVEVEPMVDVSQVRAVMVLLAPPPPADPDAKTKRRSEPAFGTRAL